MKSYSPVRKAIAKWPLLLLLIISTAVYPQTRIYVAPNGTDTNPGTLSLPVATLGKALDNVKIAPQSGVQILLRKGTYYLPKTLHIDPAQIGNKKLVISPYQQEVVTLNGGRKISLQWHKKDSRI